MPFCELFENFLSQLVVLLLKDSILFSFYLLTQQTLLHLLFEMIVAKLLYQDK